jgi:hypothetical protein
MSKPTEFENVEVHLSTKQGQIDGHEQNIETARETLRILDKSISESREVFDKLQGIIQADINARKKMIDELRKELINYSKQKMTLFLEKQTLDLDDECNSKCDFTSS